VFTDVKVWEALSALYNEPSPAFVSAISKALPDDHKIARNDLVASLKRLGAHLRVPKPAPPKSSEQPVEPVLDGRGRRRGEWTLEHHLGGKPSDGTRTLLQKAKGDGSSVVV
jgi:hypothetical protein